MNKMTNKQIKDIARLYMASVVMLDNGFDYANECDIIDEDRQRVNAEMSKIAEKMLKDLDVDAYPTSTQDIVAIASNINNN